MRVHDVTTYLSRLVKEPKGLIRDQRKKASLKQAFIYLLAYCWGLMGVMFVFMVFTLLLSSGPKPPMAILIVFLGMGFVFFPVVLAVETLIATAVLYLIVKVLKGGGKFEELFYLIIAIALPGAIIYNLALLVLLAAFGLLIPVLGIDLAELMMTNTQIFTWGIIILNFVFYLFPLYLLTLIIREVSGLSTRKSVACWLVPMSVLMIPFILMFALLPAFPSMGSIQVEGLTGLEPVFPSMVLANSPDNATFIMVFTTGDDMVRLDGQPIQITKKGLDCRVENLFYDGVAENFGFYDQRFEVASDYVVPEKVRFFLRGDVVGAGCGGVVGENYRYDVTLNYVRGKTEAQLSNLRADTGKVSGNYVDSDVSLSLSPGGGFSVTSE